MGAILFFVSIVLAIIVFPIGFIYGIIIYFFEFLFGKRKKREMDFNKWLEEIAICVDMLGNVIAHHFFNDVFCKGLNYPHGKRKETISSVLGKNKKTKNLNWTGRMFARVLHSLDKNHVEKSIDKNV